MLLKVRLILLSTVGGGIGGRQPVISIRLAGGVCFLSFFLFLLLLRSIDADFLYGHRTLLEWTFLARRRSFVGRREPRSAGAKGQRQPLDGFKLDPVFFTKGIHNFQRC